MSASGHPSELDLRGRLSMFVNKGGMQYYSPTEKAVQQLVARYPAEADAEARFWEGMRVGQLCDLNCLPASSTTRQERDRTKDYVDRCELVGGWLVAAGAAVPAHQLCPHGKML